VLVDGPEQALEVANAIAPEHLELMCADPDAGAARAPCRAVFCGPGCVGDTSPARVTCCGLSAPLASARRSPSPTSRRWCTS
jgi:hypothetical protein